MLQLALILILRWRNGITFQVACPPLVPNEPLFGIYAAPVDSSVLGQNLRFVKVHLVFYCGNSYLFVVPSFCRQLTLSSHRCMLLYSPDRVVFKPVDLRYIEELNHLHGLTTSPTYLLKRILLAYLQLLVVE